MNPRTKPIALWQACKGNVTLICDLVVWPHGFDLRVWRNGELYRTELCRDQERWLAIQREWREKLGNGWTLDLSPAPDLTHGMA